MPRAQNLLQQRPEKRPEKSAGKYDAPHMTKPGARKPVSVRVEDVHPAKSAVSIHDVAAAASVSIATVSRVMNNPSLVSPSTAARVQEVIKKLGYVPNPFAQGVITRASRVLGFALPDIHGEFYSELLRGADNEARKQGYHLLVSSEPRATDADAERQSSFVFGLIDGMAVMITDANNSLSKEARESQLPTVVLDTDLHTTGVDSIVVDNIQGTREAAHHLLASLEARQLYFVGGPQENFDTQQRGRAFLDALRATGWQPRADQAAFGEYSIEWGRQWAEAMLKKKGLDQVGILAGNDDIAIGIMQTATDAGVRIPEQLRVIGFDDTRLAALVRPRLSSVRVPMADVGAAAIRLLVKRIEERDAPTTCLQLPTTLVVRESSTPKPR
jgi:LacI family transcriptional regulator